MSYSPVIIITGASRGIGKATVIEALTKFDAKVVAVARNEDALKQVHDQVSKEFNKGDCLELVAGDVTDPSLAQKAVKAAVDKWGRLDSIIANAGVLEPIASIAEGSVEQWKRLYDVNVFSIITLVQASLPHLRQSEKGSIIIVSSGAALKGYKGWGAYGSSKAAVNHIASTLEAEEKNVTTIAIRPGVVDTDMQGAIRSTGEDAMKDDHAKFMQLHSEGKLLKPETPGHVLAALAHNPPKELSGLMYEWNHEKLKDYQRSENN
ncbi:hypothetical protein G6F57_010835 [Rhizopus arrhizus]|uniref:Uncharacterized protein n=1 Tax=Rhizopus oryzae TaxID=64495 RepID=A0A9P6WZL0_RHIOR|nr:hypothetical protein G6F23_007947 [Rhizopus arrhizus]KAG1416573.1 hypothetical protein G6F58_005915 [Rhizopus delemar]KAG0757194.1 hypothetical protein G6F24_010644 [Rhizopus arrhizus]KAG0783974.1 hypothetical protein G6F21_010202 [Rhizopus arrhizus]KAG0791955.1 hypothetical protein G6F22_005998 [Rhizopus arrhizus]